MVVGSSSRGGGFDKLFLTARPTKPKYGTREISWEVNLACALFIIPPTESRLVDSKLELAKYVQCVQELEIIKQNNKYLIKVVM